MKTCLRCTRRTLTTRRKLCMNCYREHKLEYPLTRKPKTYDMICEVCKQLRKRVSISSNLCRGCTRKLKKTENEEDHCRELPLPLTSTDAWPGSEEKIAIMMDRAEKGYSIFHPSDKNMRDWLKQDGM